MNRIVRTSIVSLLLTASSIVAHHSYSDYDRNVAVTLEGTIKRVLWANPHVIVTLETQSKGEYAIEWSAVSQLARQGIETNPMKEGDRMVFVGSVNKDPTKRIMTILAEIRRPADGWHWTNPARGNTANK